MNIDLKNMTSKELASLKANVDKALANAKARERRRALKAAQNAAATYGFTLEEVMAEEGAPKKRKSPATAKAKAKQAKPASKPRYRNPADAKQTWTGKGRPPGWFSAAIDAGTDRESMAV